MGNIQNNKWDGKHIYVLICLLQICTDQTKTPTSLTLIEIESEFYKEKNCLTCIFSRAETMVVKCDNLCMVSKLF